MPKKAIPKTLKICVWNKYIGEDIGKTKCLCCKITDITQLKFHVGHIIAEANGGTLDIDNLKPICESCNKSMKTTNMDYFEQMINSKKYIDISNSIKLNILNKYHSIADDIDKLYIRLGYELTNPMIKSINKITGNRQADINIRCWDYLEHYGLNEKKISRKDFLKINNNNKLYDYLKEIDEETFLELIYQLLCL